MYEHFKGEEVFVKKMLEYKDQALFKQRLILTKFLNPYHCFIATSVIGSNSELQVLTFGGYSDAESKRVIIAPSFYEILPTDFEVTVLKLTYAKQFDTIKHKDILGALMNLGIKRELFGDIVFDGEYFYLVLDTKIANYVVDNLHQVKRSKIKLSIYNGEITMMREYNKKTFIVSSLRLDKIIGSFYKISRSKASSAISSGLVKVNHKIVEDVSYLCNNRDTISFKKHGRVIFIDCNRTTKQDNHVVEGWFYK